MEKNLERELGELVVDDAVNQAITNAGSDRSIPYETLYRGFKSLQSYLRYLEKRLDNMDK